VGHHAPAGSDRRTGSSAFAISAYGAQLCPDDGRAELVLNLAFLMPRLQTTYGGNFERLLAEAIGIGAWLGMLLNLVIAECFVNQRHDTIQVA
jgi:hypothetical protein